jgi:hypothetical protein
MGVFEPCGKSNTSQLPYRILNDVRSRIQVPEGNRENAERKVLTQYAGEMRKTGRLEKICGYRYDFLCTHLLFPHIRRWPAKELLDIEGDSSINQWKPRWLLDEKMIT